MAWRKKIHERPQLCVLKSKKKGSETTEAKEEAGMLDGVSRK